MVEIAKEFERNKFLKRRFSEVGRKWVIGDYDLGNISEIDS